MLDDITPMVITYNEATNIARTLDQLVWAGRIVVIDSGSTDETIEIIRSYPQAEVIYRPFDDFASQCNFGIAQVATTWVMSLDADYELSEALVTELHGLSPARRPPAIARGLFIGSTAGPCVARSIHRARCSIGKTGRATGTRGMATGSVSTVKSCRFPERSITMIVNRSPVGFARSNDMPAKRLVTF